MVGSKSVRRYFLASTVLMLGAAVWSGSAAAQNANTNTNTNANANGNGNGNGNGGNSQAVDPGVRGGAPGAGGPLPGLSQNELNFFAAAKQVFNEIDAVPNGLGPRFNMDGCGGCHASPATGGSSPATNPQIAVATANGAKNTVPSFIAANGPIREVRFVRNPDGTPDGGVHDLFVITGRSDASGCNIQQPDFAAAVAANNAIYRVPTPTFGLGLVEAIPDSGLQAALAANAQQNSALGISGNFNTSGNDGTITRFGWKAQNKSLLVFAGEAYNVEQGVTNDAFPNERETNPNCQFNPLPESTTNFSDGTNGASPASGYSQDIVNFAAFIRMLAPPTPASGTTASTAADASTTAATPASTTATTAASTTATTAASTTAATPASTAAAAPASTTAATPAPTTAAPVQVADATGTSVLSAASGSSSASAAPAASTSRGQQVFANIGCAACHIVNQTTGKSVMTGQSNVTFQPLSDFALHQMGTGLADGISQGAATGSEFRTAPLWGVGQRIYFLHDGRTQDLNVAIQQHSSSGSEANGVVRNFNQLSVSDQQAVLNYLRSL